MKKLLLLFTLLLLCTPLIKAADIVETFESFTDAKKTWLPSSANTSVTECTSTITNLKWNVSNVWAAKASGKIYMTFKKGVGAYMETTPGIKCSEIKVSINSAGSNGGMDLYAVINGEDVAIAHKDATSGGEYSFPIDATYQTANTTFKIKNTQKTGQTTGNQISVKSITFVEAASGEPDVFEAEFDAVNVEAGQEFTVAPKNQTAPAITYSITKNEGNIIEAIDEDNGKFKALTKGTAEITASWEGNDQWTAGSATIAVTVSAALKPVTITPSAETITIDLANSETAANPFTVDPEGLALSYESSAPEVVEVAADGTLTAKATGTAVVTASFAGNDEYRNAEAKVNVNVINSNALYTDINIENLINRDGDTGNGYAIERTYTDNQGISYLGHYNSNNGMQFNQGNSTDNGVIVSANPNKYKIESIEFTFATGSRDNALTIYASNKAFNAVEETSEVLISDNIKKGTDNKVTVSFAQKDYCYFSMMAPSMLTLSNIRVNWVGQKAEKPSTPDVIYDSENNKFIINVDHGYHIHHYLEINNTPALATFAEAEPAWNKVENHTYTLTPERALEAGECYDLNVRAVDPEDETNIAGNFIRVTSAGVVTGIEDINIDENANYEQAFDIYGRAVSDDYKGLVIKGGKKYIRR